MMKMKPYIKVTKALNDELDKTIKIQKIINDLSQVPKESQSLILANAFTESSLNYEVIHKGKFDKTTRLGI